MTHNDKYLIIRCALKSKKVSSSNWVFEKYQANWNMISVEAAERSLDVGIWKEDAWSQKMKICCFFFVSQGEQNVSSSTFDTFIWTPDCSLHPGNGISIHSFSSKQLKSPWSSAMSGYTPEARDGYFCPINVEYECLSLDQSELRAMT